MNNLDQEVELGTIFKKIGELIFSFFSRIEKNLFKIFIVVIAFIAFEVTTFFIQKPFYRSSALVRSNVLDNKDVYLLFQSFNEYLKNKDYSFLSSENERIDKLTDITDIELKNSFKVELIKSKDPIFLEQDTIQEETPFRLELRLKSNENISSVGETFIDFLNSYYLVEKEKDLLQNNLIFVRDRLIADLAKSDSSEFKSMDYNLSNNTILFLNDPSNFVKINQHSRTLFEELILINERIERIESEGAFYALQTSFTNYNIEFYAKELTAKGLLSKSLLGFIIAYIFILYLERRKKNRSA